MTKRSQTNTTRLWMCLPGHGSSVIGGYDHSARALGMPTRISQGIMLVYSSSRITSGRNELLGGELSNVLVSRFVELSIIHFQN